MTDPTPIPPVLGHAPDAALAVVPRELSRWRLGAALVLLAVYVALPALVESSGPTPGSAILPPTVGGVLLVCIVEFSLFAFAFFAASVLGHLRGVDLYLRWPRESGWWIWPRTLGWSLALRLGVGAILLSTLVAARLSSGEPLTNLEEIRPKVEAVVDAEALFDPLYMLVMLTVVSFGLAGFREELWRAGMLSLLGRFSPGWFGGRRGAWLAIVPVAVIFGLGHTPQGFGGVAATTALGVGLGAILVFHRSLWDAVLVHGFFNATTFVLLPWLAELLPQAASAP